MKDGGLMTKEIAWDTDVPSTIEMGPFNELIGAKVIALAPGRSHLRIKVEDRHLNSLGIAHGGAVASLLDHAMGLAAGYIAPGIPRRKCVTVSLNIQFLGATLPGDAEIKGRVVGGGKNTFFVEAEMKDHHGRTLARGQSVFNKTSRT